MSQKRTLYIIYTIYKILCLLLAEIHLCNIMMYKHTDRLINTIDKKYFVIILKKK